MSLLPALGPAEVPASAPGEHERSAPRALDVNADRAAAGGHAAHFSAASAEPRKAAPKPAARPRKRPARKRPASQPTTTSAPAPESYPAPTTYAEARRFLNRIPAADRSPAQVAELTALQFVLALPDPNSAAEWVDAAGYQTLPAEGPLPEVPARPLYPEAVHQALAARPLPKLDAAARETLTVVAPHKAKDHCASAAAWMLPANDWLIVLAPVPGVNGWLQHDACLVVRVRAKRGTIIGGTLLEALHAAPAPKPD